MSAAHAEGRHPGPPEPTPPAHRSRLPSYWTGLLLCSATLALASSCAKRQPDQDPAATKDTAAPSPAEVQALADTLGARPARHRLARRYPRRANTHATAEIAALAADYNQAKDPAARRQVMDRLATYCDPAAIPLVESALADPSPEVRAAALDALAGYTSADVVPLALKGLQDMDVAVRRAAMEALSCVEDATASEPIALAFTDADASVREAAFDCLQELPYQARISLLEEAIKAPAVDVRQNAVSELEDLSNHDAMDLLIQALKDHDAQVRRAAADAIWFLVSERFADAATAHRWWEANRKRFDEDLFEKD
jgi:hypothetical protein